MNCDRCGNAMDQGKERNIRLIGISGSILFQVCQDCSDRINDAARLDVLGRKAGMKELQQMARRMPERVEELPAVERGKSPGFNQHEVLFDELQGTSLEWLREWGYLAESSQP